MGARQQYWLRIVGAWILLQFASRVMKSAEQVLHTAASTHEVETVDSTATEIDAA